MALLAAGSLAVQAASLGGEKPKNEDSPFNKDGAGGDPKSFKIPKLPKRPADEPAVEDPDFVAARQLFWSGNYDQAAQLFTTYLSKNPDHEPTKLFLRMIQEARHYDPEKEKVVRKALEEVRFKRIDWKDMSLDAAITFLRNETRRQIPEGEVVNFVNLVPASAGKKSITLSAEDATLDQLIQRIAEQAGVFHHVDSDGIVFETKARS